MAKKTLNLTVEESIKEQAKYIAKKRGISVSKLFEEAIARKEEPDSFKPKPGSAVYELMNLIPESEKSDDNNYDKLKMDALKEKYDLFAIRVLNKPPRRIGTGGVTQRYPQSKTNSVLDTVRLCGSSTTE